MRVLVVIAIIGIFAAALFPVLRGYLGRAEQMNETSKMRQERIEQQLIDLDGNTYPE
jgi:type II secretory pathway pseudopilin PulG